MQSEKDLVDMAKVQIKLEEETTRKIRKMEKATTNLAAKLFLAEMRFDTEKHAKILQTMLELMEQREPEVASRTLWDARIRSYVDAFLAKETLEDHIKIEMNMLEHIKRGIKRIDDPALKKLFEHIADDERKHHRILKTILEKAFEMGP